MERKKDYFRTGIEEEGVMSESQHLTYKKKRKIKSQRLLSEQERFQQVLTLTLALGPPPSPVCPDPCDMCRQL